MSSVSAVLLMNNYTNKISNVLQQVRLLKNKYNEIAAVTGEDFNIFSILRIKHKEELIPGTQYLIHGILDGRGERKGLSETNGN